MSKFSTATIMKGPKGDTGETGIMGTPGPKGSPTGALRKNYCLRYAGLDFIVWIEPDTFTMIEDATNVAGDELDFIKVINQRDWESIREAWADAWQKQKAYRAFEIGDFEDE